MEEVSHCCDVLTLQIRRVYEPEAVIAIDDGGSVLGELLAKELNVKIVHISVRRDIKISRRYSLDPSPLNLIMRMYHNYLFQTVKPTIVGDINCIITDKKVLIVDDAIHSGATLDVVIPVLKALGVTDIKIAALSYVASRQPHFSALPQGNYCFPWSVDYADFVQKK